MTTFKEHVILITGSSRDIGRSIALAFAKEKSTVIINYLANEKAALKTVEDCKSLGGHAEAIKADIKNEVEVKKMIDNIIKNYGKLTCLVNNAFASFEFNSENRKIIEEITWNDYLSQFEGALKYTHNTVKYCLPHLKKQSNSSIINITSNLTKRPIIPYHQYNIAKSTLESYTKNLARELGQYNIRVNCIAPGLVYPTKGTINTKESLKEEIIHQTPLGRIATPNDIAGSVLFFSSQWSDFITGQTLYVDGGFTI